MVRVELHYNPYLLETEVLFNGNQPMINSLVEKYRHEPLQIWINDIPKIFHDEMNGYDFDLYFTGTQLDFEELKKAFERAGISENQVRLFHKSVILGRKEKTEAIDNLLKWLGESSNRKFDPMVFQEKYKDLFEGAYSFIVIGGSVYTGSPFDDIEVAIENVDSADELKNTDLHYTPILICLDRKTSRSIHHNLPVLLNRQDISQEQLFFFIKPELLEKTERLIRDLGVKNPQIVKSVNDPIIHEYLECYPVSEYVHDAIKAFNLQTNRIGKILRKENSKYESYNEETHRMINSFDDILKRLKLVNDRFKERDNLNLPGEFTKKKEDLSSAVNRWKIKKTKITNSDEARKLSCEYEKEVQQQFTKFRKSIIGIYVNECTAIRERLEGWYLDGDLKECDVSDIRPAMLTNFSLPEIANELMKLKTDRYIEAKEDILDKLFKTTGQNDVHDLVLETAYYYETWRSYVLNLLEPIEEKMIKEAYTFMQDYYNRLSDKYINEIGTMLIRSTEGREKLYSRLSADEKKLQEENDWHTIFCDRLHDIERA